MKKLLLSICIALQFANVSFAQQTDFISTKDQTYQRNDLISGLSSAIGTAFGGVEGLKRQIDDAGGLYRAFLKVNITAHRMEDNNAIYDVIPIEGFIASDGSYRLKVALSRLSSIETDGGLQASVKVLEGEIDRSLPWISFKKFNLLEGSLAVRTSERKVNFSLFVPVLAGRRTAEYSTQNSNGEPEVRYAESDSNWYLQILAAAKISTKLSPNTMLSGLFQITALDLYAEEGNTTAIAASAYQQGSRAELSLSKAVGKKNPRELSLVVEGIFQKNPIIETYSKDPVTQETIAIPTSLGNGTRYRMGLRIRL